MADIKCPDTLKRARFFALINYNKRVLIFRFKKILFIKTNFNKSVKYRVFKSGDLRTFYN
jgi:serine protease inhibitor ecotin